MDQRAVDERTGELPAHPQVVAENGSPCRPGPACPPDIAPEDAVEVGDPAPVQIVGKALAVGTAAISDAAHRDEINRGGKRDPQLPIPVLVADELFVEEPDLRR